MIGLIVQLLMLPVRLAMALVGVLISVLGGSRRSRRQRPLRTSPRSLGTPHRSGAMAEGPAPSRHLWWALSPAYTVGVIAFVPLLHAALKLRRPELWRWVAGLAIGDIVVWILVAGSGDGESPGAGGTVGTLLAIGLAVAGTYQALGLRSEIFADGDGSRETTAAVAAGQEPAVTQALMARQRRRESRALAAEDPLLARDLMIGRPDLTRHYDDGGLIDVNHVPDSILVSHVGLTAGQAHAVIDARQKVGRFESIDEMWNLANLPPTTIDMLRDRLIPL